MTEQTVACLRDAYAWIIAHPAECWLVVSGALNLLLRIKSAERWVEQAESHRVLAPLVAVLRSLGVDPAGAMRALALLASSKAAVGGAHALLAPTANDTSPPTPRNTGGTP